MRGNNSYSYVVHGSFRRVPKAFLSAQPVPLRGSLMRSKQPALLPWYYLKLLTSTLSASSASLLPLSLFGPLLGSHPRGGRFDWPFDPPLPQDASPWVLRRGIFARGITHGTIRTHYTFTGRTRASTHTPTYVVIHPTTHTSSLFSRATSRISNHPS